MLTFRGHVRLKTPQDPQANCSVFLFHNFHLPLCRTVLFGRLQWMQTTNTPRRPAAPDTTPLSCFLLHLHTARVAVFTEAQAQHAGATLLSLLQLHRTSVTPTATKENHHCCLSPKHLQLGPPFHQPTRQGSSESQRLRAGRLRHWELRG